MQNPTKSASWATVGGIYSDQRCPDCGSKFRDDHREGLRCPNHPDRTATRFRLKFPGISCKRYKDYMKAKREWTRLLVEYNEGTYDPRDYRADKPLGFETLALQYLEHKRGEIQAWRDIVDDMGKAISYFGNTNIKNIGYADLEDFLLVKTDHAREILTHHRTGKPLSSKTRADLKATLHAFWEWLRKRQVLRLDQIPEFPDVQFELGWRKIVTKEQQQAIVDEVGRIAKEQKVWLAIKMLATYFSIRPAELLNIKEGDINLDLGVVNIREPKGKKGQRKPKTVPLLPEDIEWIQSYPKGFPHLHFFRHEAGHKGIPAGRPFGKRLLYTYWKKACKNLGIEGVDLYGGTKHSTITDKRRSFSPEQIKRASMHATNKALDRYLQFELNDLREIYADTPLTPQKGSAEKGQVIEFTKK